MAKFLFIPMFPKEPILKVYSSLPLSLTSLLSDLSPLTEFSPTVRRVELTQRQLIVMDFTGVGGWVEGLLPVFF